ncbi:DUF3515 domain-containing protein [Geodermatophilus marinus]|uniref:DUF3515 domain-containing protein n=1 Tax=Geodermatophilus sp. LHW52908 TaxID=2303986 RepID=UPI001F31A119|nr:DUF3515 domain-containing protein [Geodermatophilus sp. LHW52908]
MAVVALAVGLPLVLALAVLLRVTASDPDDDAPAEVAGAPATERADLPPLDVEVPELAPETEAACLDLVEALPFELAGEVSRPVRSERPVAHAWGDPPVVLVCGVDRPEGFVADSPLIQINGVQWYVDTSDPGEIVWTAVDRPVYVEVTVSPDTDSAPVTALGPVIAGTLPAQELDPGP